MFSKKALARTLGVSASIASLTLSTAVAVAAPTVESASTFQRVIPQPCTTTLLETRLSDPELPPVLRAAVEKTFTSSEFGKRWSSAVETSRDKEETLYPADITGLGKGEDRVASLAAWGNMNSIPGATVSVTDFYESSKRELDRIGVAVFSNYDSAKPRKSSDLKVRDIVSGTKAEYAAISSYDASLKRYNLVRQLVSSAGFSKAEYSKGELVVGGFVKDDTDWGKFVKVYRQLVDGADSALDEPSSDLVYRVLDPKSNSSNPPTVESSGVCYG